MTKSIANCGGLLVNQLQMELNASNELEIKEGVVTPIEATPTVIGGFVQVANQADSTATDVAGLVVDFNILLASLKTAKVMIAD